jgi:hypothetical protein
LLCAAELLVAAAVAPVELEDDPEGVSEVAAGVDEITAVRVAVLLATDLVTVEFAEVVLLLLPKVATVSVAERGDTAFLSSEGFCDLSVGWAAA